MKPFHASALVALSAFVSLAMASLATAGENPISEVQVVPAKLRLDPQQPTPFEVRFAVKKGWHVNANPASDKHLRPTVLSAEAGSEIQLTEVSYPQPVKFEMAGEVIDVYEGIVVIKGKVMPSANGSKEPVLRLDYQACNEETCLPPGKLRLPVTVEK